MYTTKEISIAYDFSIPTIRQRERKLGYKPITYKKSSQYLFDKSQVNEIVNYNNKAFHLPEIIYVTQTFFIIESKMNYDTEI